MDADCIKLTSYLGGRHSGDGLIDLYCQRDLAAAIVLRGVHGSGLRLRYGWSAEVPLTAVAVVAGVRTRSARARGQ